MQGNMELLTNFKFFFQFQQWKVLPKEIQSLCNILFLKLLKLSLQTRFKNFFIERDAFSVHKTSLFISFTSLIGVEWTKASQVVGMDLSNMAQFSFFLKKNI